MDSKNWHPGIRVLHWVTVPVLVACVAAVWAADAYDKSDPARAVLMQTHFFFALCLTLLVGLRLMARAASRPPTGSTTPRFERGARIAHGVLYALLVAVPLTGYIAVSGRGVPIDVLGFFSLPPLPVDKHLARSVKELHEVLANSLLGVVAVHVAAALYHGFVLKDNVLRAMLGRAKR